MGMVLQGGQQRVKARGAAAAALQRAGNVQHIITRQHCKIGAVLLQECHDIDDLRDAATGLLHAHDDGASLGQVRDAPGNWGRV